MADPTYQPLVYRRQGGNVQVVAVGGQIVTETPVIAALGTVQGDAAPLTAQQNVITGADGTVGVILPVGEVGSTITVHNASASALKVYPETGGNINAAGANTAFSLAANTKATFVCTAALTWYVPTATVGTTNGAAGVAAGYKIARGVHLQVAQSDTVVSGLTTVVAVVAGFQDAPTAKQNYVTTSIGDQAGTPVAGSFLIATFKSTFAVADDFTDNRHFNWIAVGT